MFKGRAVTSVRLLSSGHLALYWQECSPEEDPVMQGSYKYMGLALLPNSTTVGIEIHKTGASTCALINTNHPLVQWLLRAREACKRGLHGLREAQFVYLCEKLFDAIIYTDIDAPKLGSYLEGWRDIPNLPPELYPPKVSILPRMFFFREQEDS